jgi:RNA polymerase sigma-70 factor (ECF subfamily)
MNSKLKEKYLLFKLRTRKDPEVYGEIYDLYVSQIYRFIFFKVSNKEEAEDLTANVFLRTWQYINEMGAETIGNLQAFLYQVARNAVIDFYREKSQREISSEDLKIELKDQRQNLVEKIQNISMLQEVKDALQQLKDEYREVVILRYIEEMNVGETAKILGKSKGAVRVLLHRAIKTLREILTEEKLQEIKK